MPLSDEKKAYFKAYREANKEATHAAQQKWHEANGKNQYYKNLELTRAIKRKHNRKKVNDLVGMEAEEKLIQKLRAETPRLTAGLKKQLDDAELKRRRDVTIRKVRYRGMTNLPLGDRPQYCEVCGSSKKISLDHCHLTNTFRGWLCDPCNVSLGLVQDNPVTLRRLADYLENHGKETKLMLVPKKGTA